MSSGSLRQTSEWMSSFSDKIAEGEALGALNVQRLACVRAARALIGHIDEGCRMSGKTAFNEGERYDPTLPQDEYIYRSYSGPIETDEATLCIGRISVHETTPLGYRDVPHYFYIRELELDGSEEDAVIWSARNDARVSVFDYKPYQVEPTAPFGRFSDIPDLRDNISLFDERLVKIAAVLGVVLPEPSDIYQTEQA